MHRLHRFLVSSRLFLVFYSVAFAIASIAKPTMARAQTHTPATFSATGSMTEPRSSFTATRLKDGRILVAGGSSSSGSCTPTAEIYDFQSATFSPTGSMNFARCGQNATLLRDGRVLIAGGSNATRVAELYDPATNRFGTTGTELEPANEIISGMHSALLPDGTVLIVGGACSLPNGDCFTTPELYDPVSGSFKTPPGTFSGNCPRFDAGGDALTSLANGEVLWSGGYNTVFDTSGADTTSSCATLYDPSGGPTQTVQAMTTSRAGHSSTLLSDGRVLLAGGFFFASGSNGNFEQMHGSAELFDPRTNSFTPAAGSMNDSRYDHTAILQPNGHVLIAGGSNSGSSPENSLPYCDLFDPVAGTFSNTGTMEVGRVLQAAAFLPNALTLEAGGLSGGQPALTPVASAEVYAPAGAVNIGSPQQGGTVSGTVSIDSEINTGVEWLDIYIDGQYLASSPPFEISWDSTKVANGQHVVSANAYGRSGLLGSTSVKVNVANGAVALMWPPTGSAVSHAVGIGAQVTSAVQWINFYVDGNYLRSGPPFTTYWKSSSVANGTHTLSTRAYSSSGQIGADSVIVNVQN